MTFIERFAALADTPSDDSEQRLKKRYLLLTGVVMGTGGVIWGTISAWAGLYRESLIPFGYTAITIANFAWLSRAKRFGLARSVQVFISLALPFLFQWVLGGFVSSGCMMIWAMLSLVGSLSFEKSGTALKWLWMYLALTVVSGILEGHLSVPDVLRNERFAQFSFALNIATVSTAVFGLTLFFVRLREKTTIELAEKNRQLAESQSALVESEKMAALGQLVAGVAHELNTPLGAILASVENMGGALDHTLHVLPGVLAAASPAQVEGVQALLAAAKQGPITSREERECRKALHRELEAAGVAGASDVARTLVEIGIRSDAGPHLPLLRAARGRELLRSAYELGSLQRNRANIQVAANRAAKIVFALKSYAHPGAADATTCESLVDHLETVLTLYHNQIKRGVEVERVYQAGDDKVEGRHDALNQVWTNLIHNALQAMRQGGTLTVRVTEMGDGVQVSIEDTGPGIAPDIRDRLFEPFFTTKSVGEGTGLGLSISKTIVDKHGGTITVDSSPKGTAFRVALPRRAVAEGDAA